MPAFDRGALQDQFSELTESGNLCDLEEFIKKRIHVSEPCRRQVRSEDSGREEKTVKYYIFDQEVGALCFSSVLGINKVFLRRIVSKVAPE